MAEIELIGAVNKYGFPIIAATCLGGFIYYVWKWVTESVEPVISTAKSTLVALINRIRLMDNDLIRLDQKVETVMELRGKTIEKESIEAIKNINQE